MKEVLTSAKTIAMVGVSFNKQEEKTSAIRRRPSIIVMKYLQEFGYKVIPVNPFSKDKVMFGEKVVGNLEEIKIPIDIVNVFRPSKETPYISKQSIKIGAKVIWLQLGIKNDQTTKISELANKVCISNRCIKQEYQKLFLKVNPVFPLLHTD